MIAKVDTSSFDGTKSTNDSFLSGANRKFVNWAAPRVPKWIETYHLTACTYFWAGLSFFSGYMAQPQSRWLWLMVIAVIGHYVTDALDGEVGRLRKTGLERWGFYTDHFGDYLFLMCILLGLSYSIPLSLQRWLLVLIAIWSTIFINAYFIWIIKKQYTLSFFRISSIEAQLIIAVMLIVFAIFGSAALSIALKILVPFSIVGLGAIFFRTQHQLWQQDKKH